MATMVELSKCHRAKAATVATAATIKTAGMEGYHLFRAPPVHTYLGVYARALAMHLSVGGLWAMCTC